MTIAKDNNVDAARSNDRRKDLLTSTRLHAEFRSSRTDTICSELALTSHGVGLALQSINYGLRKKSKNKHSVWLQGCVERLDCSYGNKQECPAFAFLSTYSDASPCKKRGQTSAKRLPSQVLLTVWFSNCRLATSSGADMCAWLCHWLGERRQHGDISARRFGGQQTVIG